MKTIPFITKGIKGFQRGHTVPIEIRLKISKIQIGKKYTEETKRKMSIAHKGKKLSPYPSDFGENIRKRLTGKKQSPEVIAKRVAGRRGYCHSEETKRKIGKANRRMIHKTDESKIWRHRDEYKKWRIQVFKRDSYTCQKCKRIGDELHPHHIRNFSENIKLRFCPANGIALCVKCHKKFHRKYGQRRNSMDQINEFIRC